MALGITVAAGSKAAHHAALRVNNEIEASSKRLASGKAFASAKDNPTGVALATRFNSFVVALNSASSTASSAKNLLAIADGAADVASTILSRIKELATSGNSGTLSSTDYNNLDAEVSQLKSELDRLATSTTYGSTPLADGLFGARTFQVGVKSDDTINVDLTSFNLEHLNLGLTTSIADQNSSITVSNQADTAISTVASLRASIGALQSRFDAAQNAIGTSVQNLSSTLSSLQDLDFVAESSNFSSYQVVQNAAISVVAQNNQLANSLLKVIS